MRKGGGQGGRIRLGVSACLLGRKVRYDGADRLSPVLVDALGPFVEWVAVCPEVEAGLGVPREPMHLAGDPGDPRLVTNVTGSDVTGRLARWTRGRLDLLEGEGICGFVLKENSPSCGPRRVVVAGPGGRKEKGRGVFAAAFVERFPHLPVAGDEALLDPAARRRFVGMIRRASRHAGRGGSPPRARGRQREGG